MFLPVIAQANVELEKQISGKGAESVAIDTTMLQESSDEEDEVRPYALCINLS